MAAQALEAEFLGHFPLPTGSRPTARQLAVDMSRELDRASGGFPGWDGSQQIVMPECVCACGGRLVAETKAPGDILAAVQIHNETGRHSIWRERREAEEAA